MFLDLRSSSSERLKPCCIIGRLSSPGTSAGTVWGLTYCTQNKGPERVMAYGACLVIAFGFGVQSSAARP
eukprot:672867-Alexandrium_andersonii.AAC.1